MKITEVKPNPALQFKASVKWAVCEEGEIVALFCHSIDALFLLAHLKADEAISDKKFNIARDCSSYEIKEVRLER